MSPDDFQKLASRRSTSILLVELWQFLRQTKKWWLFPVVVALLMLGLLIWMSSTAAAPFIYTLF
ncbi:MAG TPA: DUF5989 family protein [Gemmataceae bacterium]|nr:DUF5989 family protein [Gemmataceae bacterium]